VNGVAPNHGISDGMVPNMEAQDERRIRLGRKKAASRNSSTVLNTEKRARLHGWCGLPQLRSTDQCIQQT
jgi:hypothetical protein